MRILIQYAIKEFFPSFLLGMWVFTFVLFIGQIFPLVAALLRVSPSPEVVLQLLLNTLSINITYAIPMGVLFGGVDSLARFSADGEIVGINSTGLKTFVVVRPLMVTILFLATFCLYMQSHVAPRANLAIKEILEKLKVGKISSMVEDGVHMDRFKDYIIYIDKVEGNKLKGITIYDLKKEEQSRTIIAQKGELLFYPDQRKTTLKLYNGSIMEFDKDNLTKYTKSTFGTRSIELAPAKRVKQVDKKKWDMTIPELNARIHYFREKGITPYALLAELHKRISVAYSPLFFLLVGVILGAKARKKSKGLSFGLSLPVIIIYYIILSSAEMASEKGLFSPLVLMWLPNLSLGAFAFLFAKEKR